MKTFTQTRLIIITAIFLMLFGNFSFFDNITNIYPLNIKNSLFLASLFVTFCCGIILLMSLACFKYTIKPVLIMVLIASASAAYFMDTYNVIISDEMVENIIQTNVAEVADLMTIKFAVYFILLGLIPAIFIYRQKIQFLSLKKEIISRLKLFSLTFAIMIGVILVFGSYYTSFFREHKVLRYYSNPSYFVYSVGSYISQQFKENIGPIKKIGLDARIIPSNDRRKIVILVVGESARADRFSLNGYKKETNPLLKKENIINFSNFSSCGTSTAYSVPCMFSMYTRSDFDMTKGNSHENVLDVLSRAGVNVIWLDNNSSSKGVAKRVTAIDYKSKKTNPECDIECRDVGMLANLPKYIKDHPKGDFMIVLHQMGNHGPAYYKRYPANFEKFKPVCKTNQIEKCTDEKINNTYDNVILYTDYFLSRAIGMLKTYNGNFDTSLIYMSDHGESLGESGLYLHGLPYFIAPAEQTRIPALMWFNDGFASNKLNINALKLKTGKEYSHDILFHTLLGIFNVSTDIYMKELDVTLNN